MECGLEDGVGGEGFEFWFWLGVKDVGAADVDAFVFEV